MSDFTENELNSIEDVNVSNLNQDDLGQFPRSEYYGKSNISNKALGIERNDLKWPAQADDIVIEEQEKISSQYPHNQISETVTGHSFEMDDTPGNERVLIKHNTGAGIELSPDGSIKISALENKIEVTGGDHRIIVYGDAKMSYQGNLDIDVKGSYNLNCLEYNLNVEKNKVENVFGKEDVVVKNGVTKQVTGSVNNYVTENLVNTILGSKNDIVKNGYDISVEGSINLAAKDDLFATAEDTINIAADNTTISANDMTVQGGSGTIGGTSMLFSGKGAIFEQGVTAPTFHGNLNGLAKEASESYSQNYPDGDASPSTYTKSEGTPNWLDSTHNTATPTITKPTATGVLTYLTKAAGGIKKVVIDRGNHLKRIIDPRDDFGGL